MAQKTGRGVLSFVLDLVFRGKKCRATTMRIEGGDEDTFETVSGVLGPDFALQASTKPELLQKSQRLQDGFVAQVEQALNTMDNKLQLAASLGRGFQQELFRCRLSSDAQILLGVSRQQTLTAALWTARLGLDNQADMFPINIMELTFQAESAVTGLQAILDASRDMYTNLVPEATLVPILRSFALVLGVNTYTNGACLSAIVKHPALQAAFEALAGHTDNLVLCAAADAILAAVSISSSGGTVADGAQSLADYLFKKAVQLAPVMEVYAALAATGNFTYHAQAAAHAKVLAGVATAYINPLAGFLQLTKPTWDEHGRPMPRYLVNSEIIAAMAAMRTYPAADVAQESALFWRILLNSRGTAMRWVVELRLRDASTLVDLISRAYAYLLQALNNRALLPENLWAGLSPEQQSMLVLLRNTTLEPLLETVEVMGMKDCLNELVDSCTRRQETCKWAHHEALLACLSVLHGAFLPLGEDTGSLRAVFEGLPELPRLGSLPATAARTISLYMPWATALFKEKPEEGRLILDAFTAFLAPGDIMAPIAEEAIPPAAEEIVALVAPEVEAPAVEEPEAKTPQSESVPAAESATPYNSEPHREASWHCGEDETAPQAASVASDADSGNAEVTEEHLEDEAYAAEEVPPSQDVEEASHAGSETAQVDADVSVTADVSGAETRPKPQQCGIWAAPQAVEPGKYYEDEDDSELESLTSSEDSIAYISDAESTTDPCQEDLADATDSESDEELEGMGCAPGWACQLEGQGSSLLPSPAEMGLECQSTATSQDEECAAEEVPAFQDQEEDSDASETSRDDSIADVSDAETRLEPQQCGLWAQPQAVELGKYYEDEEDEDSDLDSVTESEVTVTSPEDSNAYNSNAESSLDPCQEDLEDGADSESDEALDGMGCTPGWACQLEGQGLSLVSSPSERALEGQSTATSQVAPASAPTRRAHQFPLVHLSSTAAPARFIGGMRQPYQPPLMHVSRTAAPAGAPAYLCPEIQALLEQTGAEDSPSLYSERSSAVGAPDRPAPTEQEPSTDEDGSGTVDEGGRIQQEVPAPEASSNFPGTLLGKLYWAAGAAVGTAQGLCRILK